MRKEYDFSKMKGRKNPYAKRLKKQVTIRMGVDITEYFKKIQEYLIRISLNYTWGIVLGPRRAGSHLLAVVSSWCFRKLSSSPWYLRLCSTDTRGWSGNVNPTRLHNARTKRQYVRLLLATWAVPPDGACPLSMS